LETAIDAADEQRQVEGRIARAPARQRPLLVLRLRRARDRDTPAVHAANEFVMEAFEQSTAFIGIGAGAAAPMSHGGRSSADVWL